MATRPIVIGIQGDTSRLKKVLNKLNEVSKDRKERWRSRNQSRSSFATAAAVGVVGVNAAADLENRCEKFSLPEAGADTFGQLSDQVKDFSKDFGVLPEVIPSSITFQLACHKRTCSSSSKSHSKQQKVVSLISKQLSMESLLSSMRTDQTSQCSSSTDLMFTVEQVNRLRTTSGHVLSLQSQRHRNRFPRCHSSSCEPNCSRYSNRVANTDESIVV